MRQVETSAAGRGCAVAAINAYLDREKAFARFVRFANPRAVQAEIERRARRHAGKRADELDWEPPPEDLVKAAILLFALESEGRPAALRLWVSRQEFEDAKAILAKGGQARPSCSQGGAGDEREAGGVRLCGKGDGGQPCGTARFLANNANAVVGGAGDGVEGLDGLENGFSMERGQEAGKLGQIVLLDEAQLRCNVRASLSPESVYEWLLEAVDETRWEGGDQTKYLGEAAGRREVVCDVEKFLDHEKAYAALVDEMAGRGGALTAAPAVVARAREAAGKAGRDRQWKPQLKDLAKASMSFFTEESEGCPLALRVLVSRDDLIIAKEIVDKKGKAEFRYLREDVWKDKDCKAVEVVRRGGDFRRVPAAARFIANNVRG